MCMTFSLHAVFQKAIIFKTKSLENKESSVYISYHIKKQFCRYKIPHKNISIARALPSQKTLGKGGELAFPILYEVPLGHEVVELLSFL